MQLVVGWTGLERVAVRSIGLGLAAARSVGLELGRLEQWKEPRWWLQCWERLAS